MVRKEWLVKEEGGEGGILLLTSMFNGMVLIAYSVRFVSY